MQTYWTAQNLVKLNNKAQFFGIYAGFEGFTGKDQTQNMLQQFSSAAIYHAFLRLLDSFGICLDISLFHHKATIFFIASL